MIELKVTFMQWQRISGFANVQIHINFILDAHYLLNIWSYKR